MSSTTNAADRPDIELVLRKSEDRFRQVVETAPYAMVMIDGGGRIVLVNAQAENVFGYPRNELLGQSVELLVPQRFQSRHPALRTSLFAAPQARPMGAGRDLYGVRKDGTEVPVEIGLSPIETDEGTMVLSAIVDISDRKHKEARIAAALREKEILLGEIHHRVKNNLQIVHSLLDLQSGRISDTAAQEILRDSQNRVKSMSLIHQMLYQSNDFAVVDFNSFLDSLLPTLVSSYGTDPERIALTVNATEVRLPIDCAVPCGLIVNELISNALKHAFPDGRNGNITVELGREAGRDVVLSVSDDGVGIAEDWNSADGTTLGLQLVTLLSEQVNGALSINRSNPTKFLLRFSPEDKGG